MQSLRRKTHHDAWSEKISARRRVWLRILRPGHLGALKYQRSVAAPDALAVGSAAGSRGCNVFRVLVPDSSRNQLRVVGTSQCVLIRGFPPMPNPSFKRTRLRRSA